MVFCLARVFSASHENMFPFLHAWCSQHFLTFMVRARRSLDLYRPPALCLIQCYTRGGQKRTTVALNSNKPAKTGYVDMNVEKSPSDSAGRRGFLEAGGTWTGSQKQGQVGGTEQEPGVRKCQGANGVHTQRTQKPGGSARRRVRGAARCLFPESSQL